MPKYHFLSSQESAGVFFQLNLLFGKNMIESSKAFFMGWIVFPQNTGWGPNTQYLWMWLYFEIGSL